MVRFFTITAIILGLVLFGGPFSSTPALALTPDVAVLETMDCEDCSTMEDMRMSDTVCSSSCALSGLINKEVLSGVLLHLGKKGPFEVRDFSLLGRTQTPEPHPPKQPS